jgi:hypothetical protein
VLAVVGSLTIIAGCGSVCLLACCCLARNASEGALQWTRGLRERVSWGRPRLFSTPEAKAAFKRARRRRAEQLIDLGKSLDHGDRQHVLAGLRETVSTY